MSAIHHLITICPTQGNQRTGQHKENNPVDNKDGPEDGNVENGEPAAYEADGDGTGSRVPELELRQAADERPELFVLLCGEAGACISVFQALILGEGGVEFGCQKGEEEVQEVDAESVSN